MKLSGVSFLEHAKKLNLGRILILVLKSKAPHLFYKKCMEVSRENLYLDIAT